MLSGLETDHQILSEQQVLLGIIQRIFGQLLIL
jgi:hypothetical protein